MENEPKPKVLIVDDEDSLRIGVKRLLQSEGYDVTTAPNGTEGILIGTSQDFDLAIIDLKMPDIGGLEVLKEIRSKNPNTICYIATAFASYDTAVQSTKIGADSYIQKPFTSEELLRHLKLGYEKRKLLVAHEMMIKDRERRLLEVAFERTRLNTIINSIADGVLVVNKDGQAVLYNPAVLKFLQMEEINIEEFIVSKLPPEIAVIINQYLYSKNYNPNSYFAQVELKPNRELFAEVTCSPVPHPDNSLAGVVIVLKDITELKRVEHLKSQFVSMVAHELKAPIAATLGFINLLLNREVNISKEQHDDFLNRSEGRLKGLLSMINDLLDISRIEMNTVVREIKEVILVEIIKDVLNLFQFDIAKKKLKVSFNFEENLPSFKADFTEMQRLVTNFISNAIKYNKNEGEIQISLTSSNNYLKFLVKDSGIGLKPNEKEKLFSEFFRAKNEFTKNIHGTGLGLSLVKRIIDSYNGKIEVDSQYGAGTTFIIYLPYKTSAA
jgi:PAS domain S-box-containing protein